MANAAPPVLSTSPQAEHAMEVQKQISSLEGVLGNFTKTFSEKAEKTIEKTSESIRNTAQTTTKSVVSGALGPISALAKPFENLFGFDLGDKVAGLFNKRERNEGKGLFGSGEPFKGSLSTNKIRQIDPGAVFLSDTIKDTMGEEESGGFFSRFMNLLAGGGLIASAIGMLLSGLTDDGPFKGLKKVVGRFLWNMGSGFIHRITKPFSGLLDNVLKPMRNLVDNILKPIRGVMDNFFKPLRAFVGNVWTRAKVFLDNILKPFKGMLSKVWTPIKSLFDEIGQFAAKTFGRSALGGGIKKLFAPVLDFVMSKAGKLAKGLKFVPGIGSIVSMGFAVSRFRQGDIAGGILEMLAGIADLVPGVGTAISWGFDIFLAARDMGAFRDGGIIKANLKDVFKNIWKWVKDKGKALFGIIGSVTTTLFTGAIEWVGEKVSGVLDMGRWAVDTATDWLSGVFDSVMQWVGKKIGDAIGAVEELGAWVDEKVLTPLGNFFTRVWSAVTTAWDAATGWIDTKIINPIKGIFDGILDIFATFRLWIAETLVSIPGFGRSRWMDDFKAGQERLGNLGMTNTDITKVVSGIAENLEGKSFREVMAMIGSGTYSDDTLRDMINVEDAIIRPNGEVIRTHPDDTLIASQNPVTMSSGNERQSNQVLGDLNRAISESTGASIVNELRELVNSLKNQQSNNVAVQNNNYASRFSPVNVMRTLTTEAL